MKVELLRTHFAELPEPALPPELWPRIERARVRQRTRRRQLLATSVMAAAMAVISLPLLHDRIATAPDIMAGAPRAPLREHPLRTLDRELQHAYERGASDQELKRLWQQREALARQGADADIPRPVEI
ncbi:hypothetical protein [uncultured Pseudoxanthomonas sp.]|uniref:hypothetical protein n=1 Tax=uncultured Pseudoxanthomonas sp. TaxID=281701 RepID=UPI0026111895|nr:hypothetical protein [uncultured Pseudoxanthomonas sp.]